MPGFNISCASTLPYVDLDSEDDDAISIELSDKDKILDDETPTCSYSVSSGYMGMLSSHNIADTELQPVYVPDVIHVKEDDIISICTDSDSDIAIWDDSPFSPFSESEVIILDGSDPETICIDNDDIISLDAEDSTNMDEINNNKLIITDDVIDNSINYTFTGMLSTVPIPNGPETVVGNLGELLQSGNDEVVEINNNTHYSLLSTISVTDTGINLTDTENKCEIELPGSPGILPEITKKQKRRKKKKKNPNRTPLPHHILQKIIQEKRKRQFLRRLTQDNEEREKQEVRHEREGNWEQDDEKNDVDKKEPFTCKIEVKTETSDDLPVIEDFPMTERSSSETRTFSTQTVDVFRIAIKDDDVDWIKHEDEVS